MMIHQGQGTSRLAQNCNCILLTSDI